MKFDDMPNFEYLGCPTIRHDGDEVFKAKTPEGTCGCGAKTLWYSISFGCPFCSTECLDEMWNGYWESLKK